MAAVKEEVANVLAENQKDVPAIDGADLKEIISLLKDIKENNEKELKVVKRQSLWGLISSALALIVVIILLVLGFKVAPTVTKVVNEVDQALVSVEGLLTQVDGLLGEVNGMMDDVDTVMNNASIVTDNLAKTDLTSMLNNVNELVVEAESSIADAMTQVNAIDIESLNGAIDNLGKIVAPLAKLFGK